MRLFKSSKRIIRDRIDYWLEYKRDNPCESIFQVNERQSINRLIRRLWTLHDKQ